MAFGVLGVDVPVAPWHVSSNPLDRDPLVPEEVRAMHDFSQRTGLPGNLVDRHLPAATPAATGRRERVHHLLGEQHESVMVMAMMEEVTPTVLDVLQGITHVRELFEVQDVRYPEPQEIAIEVYCLLHIGDVEAKVAQPADLEGLLQHHAADVIGLLCGSCGSHGLPLS